MPRVHTVYINGTNQETDPEQNNYTTSLANILHAMTVQNENRSSVCLDGCSINNPYSRDLGAIFTFNLEAQIDEIVKDIREKLSSGEKLTLNLFGFSRGGAGVLWICQKLKDISPEQLEINVSSFEPVPGNFIRGSYLDNLTGSKTTLSGIIADLSECDNVKNMQVLFTHIPLPDIACHGPILPIKPRNCTMQVDVVPGCHNSTQLFMRRKPNLREKKLNPNISSETRIYPMSNEVTISFHYVSLFLESCGTQLDWDNAKLCYKLNKSQSNPERTLLNIYNEMKKNSSSKELDDLGITRKLQIVKEKPRAMHYYNEISTDPAQEYVNLHHKQLAEGHKPLDNADCMLKVKDSDPKPTWWNGQKSISFSPMFTKSTLAVGSIAAVAAASSSLVAEDSAETFKSSLKW